ncbi:zinc finger domain-containing protein [Penicillium frequentans]|uniref:Zinc finger domain-containing protein n=1 Tax=Penicillium frequentans TaxID=3151616 RepID=A0AAD6D432_9EURO|nr:zinc finger domain-containing protein [Penicillium glabrum]
MSLGLAHTKRFAEADTIEARFKLLLPTKENIDVRDEFLEDARDSCNAPRKRTILRDLVANEEEDEFVCRQFYAEGDGGPTEIWY